MVKDLTNEEIIDRLLFTSLPYEDEVEVFYRDYENQKYITLVYDRKKYENGEIAMSNIIDDVRKSLNKRGRKND